MTQPLPAPSDMAIPADKASDRRTLHVIWASVALIALFLAAAVVIVLNKGDFTVILAIMGTLALPVLGVFGAAVYQKLQQVQTTSNGNLSRAMDQGNKAMEQSNRTQEAMLAMQGQMLQMLRDMHPGLQQSSPPS